MKKAVDKVTEFIMKNHDREKEKFESAMKHNYYEWEDLLYYWKSFIKSYFEEEEENDTSTNETI